MTRCAGELDRCVVCDYDEVRGWIGQVCHVWLWQGVRVNWTGVSVCTGDGILECVLGTMQWAAGHWTTDGSDWARWSQDSETSQHQEGSWRQGNPLASHITLVYLYESCTCTTLRCVDCWAIHCLFFWSFCIFSRKNATENKTSLCVTWQSYPGKIMLFYLNSRMNPHDYDTESLAYIQLQLVTCSVEVTVCTLVLWVNVVEWSHLMSCCEFCASTEVLFSGFLAKIFHCR